MGLWSAYKKNPLPLGAVCVVVAFGLFAVACALTSQITFTAKGSEDIDPSPPGPIDADSFARGPTDRFSLPSASLAQLPALQSLLVSHRFTTGSLLAPHVRSFDDPIPANGSYSSSGNLKAAWGFFQACLSSDSHESVVVNGQWKELRSLSFDQCAIIQPDCHVDASGIVVSVLEQLGLNSTQIDEIHRQNPEEWAIFENLHVVDNCGQFNASRAFAALSAITGGINLLFFVLLWRRKVPLVALTISALLTFVFSLIALAVLISTEQSDALFNSIRMAIQYNQSPVNLSLTFGLAFAMLVLGVFFSIIAAVSIVYELWNRTEGGHLSPFTLQANPESGILESHVSMYQQM